VQTGEDEQTPDEDGVEVEAAEKLARPRRRAAVWDQRMQVILPGGPRDRIPAHPVMSVRVYKRVT
jgi:hypothetical protein